MSPAAKVTIAVVVTNTAVGIAAMAAVNSMPNQAVAISAVSLIGGIALTYFVVKAVL